MLHLRASHFSFLLLSLFSDSADDGGCCEEGEAGEWGRNPSSRCHRSLRPSTQCSCTICSPRTIAPWLCSFGSAGGVGGHNTTVTTGLCAGDHHAHQWRGALVVHHRTQSEQRPVPRGAEQWDRRSVSLGSHSHITDSQFKGNVHANTRIKTKHKPVCTVRPQPTAR